MMSVVTMTIKIVKIQKALNFNKIMEDQRGDVKREDFLIV